MDTYNELVVKFKSVQSTLDKSLCKGECACVWAADNGGNKLEGQSHMPGCTIPFKERIKQLETTIECPKCSWCIDPTKEI